MMATTFGPEVAMDPPTSTMNSLDDSAAKHAPPMLSLDDNTQSCVDVPEPSPRNMPPNPLPAFVFPARAEQPSGPSGYSRSTGRRPKSTLALQNPATLEERPLTHDVPRRSPALPSFSFNPGASLSPDSTSPLPTPSLSPQSPGHASSPSRSGIGGHGHRRGTSEFVGGSIRGGDSITVTSTSPTKSESGHASPSLSPSAVSEPTAGPPRRGKHRHRRSAALSGHDLSLVLQPPKPAHPTRGSSAPTSPTEFDNHRLGASLNASLGGSDIPPVPALPKPQDLEKLRQPETTQQSSDSQQDTTPRRSHVAPRARVGFSDTLEFIPRPLSLVSSDASSTATARPSGHSVTGSLSSIVSMTDDRPEQTTTERDAEPAAPLAQSPAPQSDASRPSTAGAILECSQSIQSDQRSNVSPKRRNSIPNLPHIPGPAEGGQSQPSPTRTQKRWSFLGLDSFSTSQTATRPRDASAGSGDSLSNTAESISSTSDHVSDSAADPPASVVAKEASGKKGKNKKLKKRKVKAWAGSILKSKSRPRSSSKATKNAAETDIPPEQGPSVQEGDENSHTETAVSSNPPTVTVTESPTPRDAEPWKAPEDDLALSMIDLDAALGPFNTPLPHNPEWDAAQKAAGTVQTPTKRQLHSAQGMRGFSGPGMHYHRRAESAPEMVPFEAGRFGIPRFNSSSTMADVFEEEEEEEEDEDEENSKTTASSHPINTAVKDDLKGYAESGSEEETPPATIQPVSSPLNGQVLKDAQTDKTRLTSSVKSERSTNSLQEQVINEEPRSVDFHPAPLSIDTEDSSGSATPSPRHALGTKDAVPADNISPLHLATSSNTSASPWSLSHGSSFPSPRSPMSDAQRISTAPSSVHEEHNFQSLLLGEPGPEVRASIEIPPSLTSSTSTMTRDSTTPVPSGLGPQPRPRVPFRPGERPVSMSSTAFGRRRSSLASLSRLINSSHGERSKLSMEVPCESENEKKQKVSRTKRLSRMMQFWKPNKESSST